MSDANIKAREAEMEASKDEYFSKWLVAPMTRMGLAPSRQATIMML